MWNIAEYFDPTRIKKIDVAGKSRLKFHLKPLKMTGIIVKIERVDTYGRKVTQESNRE